MDSGPVSVAAIASPTSAGVWVPPGPSKCRSWRSTNSSNRPASARSQDWAFRTGIGFVLALMLFVTINDIVSLPIFDSQTE